MDSGSMKGPLRRGAAFMLMSFMIVTLTAGYWATIRSGGLTARVDNPRLVIDEQRIRRGTITDRDGAVLAQSITQDGIQQRIYPNPLASFATGYYSLRYGVSGIEAVFDDLLRGDTALSPEEEWLADILSRPQVGGDVRMALDVGIQQAAAEALGNQPGAVVVMNAGSGEVLAVVSSPRYDPNQLDAQWDSLAEDPSAPLLNRATQGQYQPGAVLAPVLLAGLESYTLTDITPVWSISGSAGINGDFLHCAGPQYAATLDDAIINGCPSPLAEAAEALGKDRLATLFSDFGLLQELEYNRPGAQPVPIPMPDDSLYDLGIGQGMLTVSPMGMARAIAAIANGGALPAVRFTTETRLSPTAPWQAADPAGRVRGVTGQNAVEYVRTLMLASVDNGASREAQQPGMVIAGHTAYAIADEAGRLDQWFVGWLELPDSDPIAIAVIVEDSGEASTSAAEIAGRVLAAAR